MINFPADRFEAKMKELCRIPPKLKPWEWAEKNIEIPPRVSPLRGQYKTDQWAYVREPLEAFADPEIRTITLCWSAQSTKTMTATIMVLYAIANDPRNVLFARPSLTMAKRFSQTRLIPLIEHNPVLASHKTGDRYDFKKAELLLDNCLVSLTGANPNQFSGDTCGICVLDECDKYDVYDSDKAEADLVSLAFERLKFVKNSKGVVTSTPTVPSGTVWRWFLKGDQRRYYVPCPHCEALFKITWDRMKWPKADNVETIKKETVVECPHCSKSILERHKYEMVSHGIWTPENPNAELKDRSYQLAETYTTTKWGDLAAKWIDANEQAKIGLLGPLHNFCNSSLSEVWDPTERQSRKEEEIRALQDNRKENELPAAEVLGVTAFVDTQDAGLWFCIRAWGEAYESWLLQEGYLPDLEAVKKLITEAKWQAASGLEYRVNLALIDSGGHRTKEVYEFCRQNRLFKATKGEQKSSTPWRATKIDVYPGTTTPIPGGLKLVHVNTTFYKNDLASKIALGPGLRGSFYVHGEASADYFKHMIAEYRDERGVWQKPSGRRNDLWDCEVGCFVAADMLKIGAWKKPSLFRAGAAKEKQAQQQQQPKPRVSPTNDFSRGNDFSGGNDWNPFER